MKFVCSDFNNAKKSPWIEAISFSYKNGEKIYNSNIDEIKFIQFYFRENIRIHDADNCGDDTFYFAFDTGKCYKFYYSWYIDTEEDWNLVNDFDITEITWDECKEHVSSNRDWVDTNIGRFDVNKKWPLT